MNFQLHGSGFRDATLVSAACQVRIPMVLKSRKSAKYVDLNNEYI